MVSTPPPFGHLPQIPQRIFWQLFKFTLRNLGEAGWGSGNKKLRPWSELDDVICSCCSGSAVRRTQTSRPSVGGRDDGDGCVQNRCSCWGVFYAGAGHASRGNGHRFGTIIRKDIAGQLSRNLLIVKATITKTREYKMTYLYGIGSIILQIILAVHVVRTRRPFIWIFVILIFPLVGSLVYIIAELIPEWERTNALQRWLYNVEQFFSELFSPRK